MKYYSGERSREFWSSISSIKNKVERDRLCRLGCILQNVEELVLEGLARDKIKGRLNSKRPGAKKG